MKKENIESIHRVWWIMLALTSAFAVIGAISGDMSVASSFVAPALIVGGTFSLIIFFTDRWEREEEKMRKLRKSFLNLLEEEEVMTADLDGEVMTASPTKKGWGLNFIVDRAKERGLQLFIMKNGTKWVPISNY